MAGSTCIYGVRRGVKENDFGKRHFAVVNSFIFVPGRCTAKIWRQCSSMYLEAAGVLPRVHTILMRSGIVRWDLGACVFTSIAVSINCADL